MTSARDLPTALPAIWLFMRFVRRLCALRRADPRDDLLTALLRAEEAGDSFSEDELLAMVFLLLTAGHETTVNLIGNGTLALLEDPAQLALLRENPALSKSAVEELLRFTSPVEMATQRYTREPITIAGTTIPRGEQVLAVLASANRDERQFAQPGLLDLTRAQNRHLALGQGIHYCLGAPLARLEGQIAFNTLLRRAPESASHRPRRVIALAAWAVPAWARTVTARLLSDYINAVGCWRVRHNQIAGRLATRQPPAAFGAATRVLVRCLCRRYICVNATI